MRPKQSLNKAGKGIRIRIEQCNLSTNQELDDFLIDYIKKTYKEYTSVKYKKENTLPLRYSTVKLQSGNALINLSIKVSGLKNKEGQLRYVDFNIVENIE